MEDSLPQVSPFAKARAAHPGVQVDEATFRRVLGSRELSSTHAADVYLAVACALKEPVALAHFGALLEPLVNESVGRALKKDAAFVAEVRQMLSERLLVGKRPRILDYQGTGPLSAWLRSAAVRTALNLQKSSRNDEGLESVAEAELEAASDGPELQLLKQRCKKEFKAAFRAALEELDASARELLRWNLIDGESIDRLAERLSVSRATAARRLAEARAQLMELTREQLRARLRWTHRELNSVVDLVRSQLDLSLHRHLK